MRTKLVIALFVSLVAGPIKAIGNADVIPTATQDHGRGQDSERNVGSDLDFIISANATVIVGPYHLRRVLVYGPQEVFTLENVRTVFLRLAQGYPSEDFLVIDAVSSKRHLRSIRGWFESIESFPFGDLPPASCGTQSEPPKLSAEYNRDAALEYFVYHSASGQSITVDLKRWNEGCDEPDAPEPDLLDATIFNCKEAVRRLLDSGDPSVKSRQRGTPVFEAAHWDHEEILELLLDRGADINQRSSSGWTPLIAAVMRGSSRIVEMLLTRGADINARTEDGRTALIHAVRKQSTAVVEILLAHRADVTVRDGYGKTALEIAEEGHNEDIIRQLKNAGASR